MAFPALKIAIASTAVHCGIALGPLFIWGALKKSKPILLASIFVSVLSLMQAAILFSPIPYPKFLSFLHYNWIQKALVTLITFAIIFMLRKRSQCGLNIPSHSSGFALAILTGIVFALLDVLMHQQDTMPVGRETVFFQLTMPGLQEELMYHGLMLYFLDKSLGMPLNFAGVKCGWGAIITSALFTLGHLMIFDPQWNLQIDPEIFSWINQFSFAMIMCWLRYFTKSVWPCVLAHNLDNGIVALKLFNN